MPDSVSPPGDTLRETLEALAMSRAELAARMGLRQEIIKEIVQGKASISPEVARKLEKILGVPDSFWLNRERHYREDR